MNFIRETWAEVIKHTELAGKNLTEFYQAVLNFYARIFMNFWHAIVDLVSAVWYMLKAIAPLLGVILIILGAISIVPFIAMIAWNYLAPLVGLPLITFWHALAGVVLLRIILPNITQTVTTAKK